CRSRSQGIPFAGSTARFEATIIGEKIACNSILPRARRSIANVSWREPEKPMAENDIEDRRSYRVVVNQEEQYSIWPTDRDIPSGWREVGKAGMKQECLDYIATVWVDMRPLSLRKAMGETE